MKYGVVSYMTTVVLLAAGFVYAEEKSLQSKFSGYRLPDGQTNALCYNFSLYTEQSSFGRSPRSVWFILKYDLRVWKDGNIGKIQMLKVDCLSSSNDASERAGLVTNVTASFSWNEGGMPENMALIFPGDATENARSAAQPLSAKFLPLLFKSFPNDASLEVGALWGDDSYVDLPIYYNSDAPIECWKVRDTAITISNRFEYVIAGDKVDVYENTNESVLWQRNSSWRSETYHYDAINMRNRFVAMIFLKNSGITVDGAVGRRRDYEYVMITEK
jgi:hypothetical protein